MHPYSQAFSAGLRPDPLLTVSQWADRNRMLSQKAAAEPGPWRTSRTPYLREIMDALSASSPCEQVSFMKGAQIGGTEAGNNWIGYIIDQAPGPMMAIQPTVEAAKRNSKQRIDSLIEDSPCLSGKVSDPRSRDSGNTVLAKEFPGGVLVMTGANSAVGLRSMPARYLFLDEIDGYPQDVDSEGDPVNLAIARTRTFPRRKIFRVSTATIKGRSRIEAAYEEGTGELYAVPCPLCGVYQALRFARLVWPKGIPIEAKYRCAECDGLISEYHKTWMLEHGEWWAARPELLEKHRSFHLSSLYSPVGWFSWSESAAMFEVAQKDPSRLKVFVNTVLGETWEDRGEAPEWRKLYDRRESYEARVVPRGASLITAGVDVQADRLEVSIYGWGRAKQSWLIDHVVLDGNTADGAVWNRLTALLGETFEHEAGKPLGIARLAIDSGFRTQEVYQWARSQAGRVIVVKGMDHGSAPVGQPSAIDVTSSGKKLRRSVKVWPVATPMLKSELYGWLNLEPPTLESSEAFPPGYCHFTAARCDEEFFKQLTAEQLMTKVVKGFARTEWQKMRDRNEALDCRIYARAAAAVCGIDRFSEHHWLQLEEQAGIVAPKQTAPTQAPVAPQSIPAQIPHPAVIQQSARQGGWFGNRRGNSGGWFSR